MKIFYGVQGTGNGHISRARAMAKALSRFPDIQVDWLFSGRPPEDYFEMEPFHGFECRRGLTFHIESGRVRPLKTLLGARPLKLLSDARALKLSCYDLVITDYEPITARAARHCSVRCIGIGHQYAFWHALPKLGINPITRKLLQAFAPVQIPIGLHWHPFNRLILPPIVEPNHIRCDRNRENKILVYLPFENQQKLKHLFKQFPDYQFYLYAPGLSCRDGANIHTRPPSRTGFQRDLANCAWVICNAGFELISEALQLGKRIMAKPLQGQAEQLSNAAALKQLGYARITKQLDRNSLYNWLDTTPNPTRQQYPDVAEALAAWIYGDCSEDLAELSDRLWSKLGEQRAPQITAGSPA